MVPLQWKKWAKAGAWVIVVAVTLVLLLPYMDGKGGTFICGRDTYIPLTKEATFIVPSAHDDGTACQTGWIVRPYGAPGFVWDVLDGKLDVEERFSDGTTKKFVDLIPIDPDHFNPDPAKNPIRGLRFTNKGSNPVHLKVVMMP